MRPDAIARRYARALFELAEAQSNVAEMSTALGVIADVIADPEIGRALTSPVAREQKRAWLQDIAQRTQAPKMLRNFLQLLDERDRLRHVEPIRVVFDGLVDERNGVTRAIVRSATALADNDVAEIGRVFGVITGKTVVVNVEVAADLIAGVIVEVDGTVYDGSLRTQLTKLHGQMAG